MTGVPGLPGRAAALLGMLALGACGSDGLYKAGSGPHAVVVSEVIIRDSVQQRDIAVRVATPREQGNYPVVVFSHGAFCYPQQYARVTDHWVSHGYVVIAPNHIDSPNNSARMRPDQVPQLLESRIRDLSLVVDELPAIAGNDPLAGRPDKSRMAIAGHSFGGMLAQIKAGLLLKDPATGAAVSRADPRFRAAVIMSGVGLMPQMAGHAFSGLDRPLIASGGTLDEGNVGSGQIFPWEWRMSPYTLAPPGDKYSLVLDHADHYLGGLICREDRGGADDLEGVTIVRAVQTAFLDAYLKDDDKARRFLRTADIGRLTSQRARLERK